MYNYKVKFIILAAVFFLSSCDVNVSLSNRSGTIDDDYIEEPLSKRSKQYQTLLESSNQIISLIKDNNYTELHRNYVHESMSSTITVEILEKAFGEARLAMGDIVEYKELQWGFLPTVQNNENYILSYKIVIHEKGRLDYSFSFLKDGDHQRFLGFSIKPRSKARLPGES